MRSWCAPPPSPPHRASRPPGSFCFTSPHGCKTAVAAVAITSTFPLADLAAFRRLSRKPRPLPPPGHAVSTAGSGEIRLLPPTCGSFVRRTAVRRAAAGARPCGGPAPPAAPSPPPHPFPCPSELGSAAAGRGAHGCVIRAHTQPVRLHPLAVCSAGRAHPPGVPGASLDCTGLRGSVCPPFEACSLPCEEHGARGPGHGEGGAGEGLGPRPACCGRVTVSLPKSLPVCFVWFCPGHCNSAGPPPD